MTKILCVILLTYLFTVLRGDGQTFNLEDIGTPGKFGTKFKLDSDLNTEFEGDKLRVKFKVDDIKPLRKYSFRRNLHEDIWNKNFADSRSLPMLNRPHFVGTNLFDVNRQGMFTSEEITLRLARNDFEECVPSELPQYPLTDEMISALLHYFHQCSVRSTNNESKYPHRINEIVFFDTLGGFLNYYIIPITKSSFYAGQVHLKTAESVIALFDQCKAFLNTNGNGWRTIQMDSLAENVRILPRNVYFESSKHPAQSSCCTNLDLASGIDKGNKKHMLVALPKIEPEDHKGELGAIWLPFKRKHTFDLRSPKSAYIVLKFYQTVSCCYLFEHMSQVKYDDKFMNWISLRVRRHLSDAEFYPGFGAILSLYETLRHAKEVIVLEDGADDSDEASDDDYENNLNHHESIKQIRSSSHHTSHKPKRTKCKPKKKLKQKKNNSPTESEGQYKEKHKHKPKTSSYPERGSFLNHFKSSEQRSYLKYSAYLLILVLMALFLILLCTMLCKCLKRKSTPHTTPPTKKNCFSLCCSKKKNQIDEEILIKPESKSIISTKPSRTITTTSSVLTCKPKHKCIPCVGSGKKSKIAVIETTSLEYSSSASSVRPKKGKQKVVTINEKKKSRSQSKNKHPSSGSETSKSTNNDKIKQPSKTSSLGQSNTSWETMYDS